VEATVGCKYPGEAGLGSCESISHANTTREYLLGKCDQLAVLCHGIPPNTQILDTGQ
jgi:hypothetical protein